MSSCGEMLGNVKNKQVVGELSIALRQLLKRDCICSIHDNRRNWGFVGVVLNAGYCFGGESTGSHERDFGRFADTLGDVVEMIASEPVFKCDCEWCLDFCE